MKRGGSQSMYQPNNKSIAVSKVINNNSITGLQGKSMIGNSMLNGSTRKVEGHDFSKTSKTNFEQTVNNLKNKPNQKVLEDDYINGLQQQIKYLEYELKLLKDKQIIEREGVNQLDNFLKDQIPINENILAMKNKYNATKAKLSEKLSNLNMKKSEAEDVLKTQKNEIERLHQIIQAHRKQKNDRRTEFKQKLKVLVKQITLAGDEYSYISDDNKTKNGQIKKMNEEIAIIQRQMEKEKIAEVRTTEERMKKQQKFDENVKLVKENMIETTQKCEQLAELEDKNPLLDPLQDQNALLRKKIMINQKQKSTASNNIEEIKLFLQEEARERQIERQHKNKYLIIGQECRQQLQHIQRESDNMVKDQTLRTKKVMIKEMNHELGQKEDVYNLLTDRLKTLELQCTNLIQERKELQDALEDQKKVQKELLENVSEIQLTITQNRSTSDSLKRVGVEVTNEVDPIKDELQKCKGRIPMVQRDIQRKKNSIDYLNKQVDLIKELKNLDLQHLHMISQGGNQVQNILHSFIKNWQKIKSQ